MLELAPDLKAALSAGETIVVPTAQRAAALRLAFAAWQLAAGQRAFRSADVHSLSGWLRARPGSAGPDGRLLRRLSASEEWLLWREAVTAAAAQLSVPLAAGLIDAVRRAAALLFESRIAPGALLQAGTPEAALLGGSLALIEARLAQQSAAPSWRALSDLAEHPPRRVPVFAGFASLTPARRALLEAWAAQGRAARELVCPVAAPPAAVAYAADPAAELAMMAHWCNERLRAAPGARLLVIVPDLMRRQTQVRRIFDAALDPGYLYRGAAEAESSLYALEGGQPLLDYVPIAEGLRTLQLLSSEVDLAVVSRWLRDSFWVRPEAAQRAQLDVWLRTVVPPRLDSRQLLRALRAAPPALLAQADAVATVLMPLLNIMGADSRTSLGIWSGRFAQVFALCALTSGVARQRNSHLQQVLRRLDELLQECAALGPALGQFSGLEAVAVFAQLLARTRFEPATGDPAVTLTARLDDPVLRYDGIWVSGLHSDAIPERPSLDPFIPISLQREAGIINADAAALVEQAQRALSTLHHRSHEFILSAPRRAEDLELRASPLLAPYAKQSYAPCSTRGDDLPATLRAARRIERYVDRVGESWPDGLPLPAGTRAIELQSRCPFRAYAQLRLGADPMEAPVPGITPRERGRMLHRALELLWQRLGGSVGLTAAREALSLPGTIAACVSQAAGEILQGADPEAAADEAYTQAADATGLLALRRAAILREQDRAARLIRALCELEAARTPFVIHELEAAHRVQTGAALINVRIDRMDRLADGSHAILDYKSGRAVTADWDAARTTHPQLLVYLLAAGVPVSALGVVHLDPKCVVFKGVSDTEGRLPAVKGLDTAQDSSASGGSWTQQLAVWRDQVAQLAQDFIQGEATVDPTDKACDYCHLHAFCRIADLGAAAAESDTLEPP